MCETIVPLAEKVGLILQEDQAIENISTYNLTILLQWHQVPKAIEEKMEVKRKKWQNMLESGKTEKLQKSSQMQKKLNQIF